MNNPAEMMHRFFRVATLSVVGGLVFAILFFPTKTVLKIVGLTPETVQARYYNFALFSLVFLIGLCLVLTRFWKRVAETQFQSLPRVTRAPLKIDFSHWLPWFQILFSILIIARVIHGMERPFDSDELTMPFHAIRGSFVFSWKWLFADSSHIFASLSSLLFMKLFGLSMYSARIPAVLTGCFFLFVLFGFCQRARFRPFTVVLIYTHCLASEIFTWYLHSIRGNVSMMLAVLVLFSLTFETIYNLRPLTKQRLTVFCVTLFLLPFTHGYSVIYALMSFAALAVWFEFHFEKLGNSVRQNGMRLLIAHFCFLPYLAFYLLTSFLIADPKWRDGVPGGPGYREDVISSMQLALGSSHLFVLKLLGLCLVGILIYQNVLKKQKTDYFTPLVLLFFLGFIHAYRSILGSYVTGRYLLGMNVLFIFWFAQSLWELPKAWKASLMAVSALCLVVFPLHDGTTEMFQLSRKGYYEFIKAVRKEIPGVPVECVRFSYSGAEPASCEMTIAQHFYFPSSRNNSVSCEKTYQIHFGFPWQEDPTYTPQMREVASFSDLPPDRNYRQVYTDSQGRFLAERIDAPHAPSSTN